MTGSRPEFPAEAYAAALLTLPALWPARLAALLGLRRQGGAGRSGLFEAEAPAGRSPATAWELVRSGRANLDPAVHKVLTREADPQAVTRAWASAAARVDVGRLWAAHVSSGIAVDLLGAASYPPQLAADKAAPYALFRAGAAPTLDGVRAAVVGTRRCTPAGREIAFEFGEALAAAGARVVSGLALGIDAAAHQGALAARAAPPVGVVAGGFDLPYPARHRVLWQQVRDRGVLVSEWPLGTRSEGWRFPARNRIIAALADVVVVVESRETGGSMITAEEAADRGVPVLAIPGSIHSDASAGTNRLLRDGATPACGIEDVLTALSLNTAGPSARDDRPSPSAAAGVVLAAVGWEPTGTDLLLARTGLDPGTLAVQLAHLDLDGWIAGGGGWWQRVGTAAAAAW